MRFLLKGRNTPFLESQLLKFLGFNKFKFAPNLAASEAEREAFIKRHIEFIKEDDVVNIATHLPGTKTTPTIATTEKTKIFLANKSTRSNNLNKSSVIKKKKGRTSLSKKQKTSLEKAFRTDYYPDSQTRNQLAKEIGLSSYAVKNWMQNRRQELRRNEKKNRDKIERALELERIKNYLRMEGDETYTPNGETISKFTIFFVMNNIFIFKMIKFLNL